MLTALTRGIKGGYLLHFVYAVMLLHLCRLIPSKQIVVFVVPYQRIRTYAVILAVLAKMLFFGYRIFKVTELYHFIIVDSV